MKSLKKKTILALSSTLLFGALVGVGAVKNVAEVNAAEATFNKVTAEQSDWSGTYLIVYENGTTGYYLDGGRTTLDGAGNYGSATISSNVITGEYTNYVFTVEKVTDGYTIKSASGYYMGGQSGSNKLLSTTDSASAYVNTITWNASTSSVDVVSNTSVLRFYGDGTDTSNNRFRYYKSSTYENQNKIQLYKMAVDNSKYSVSFNAGAGKFLDNKGTSVSVDAGTPSIDGTLPTEADLEYCAYKYSTLIGWNDGTTTYNPGAAYSVSANTVFTAVYEAQNTPLTLAQAIEVCELTGSNVATLDFVVTATVKSINTEYSSQYNNISITLTDGTNDLGAYRMAGGETLSIGDVITVTGKLVNHITGGPQFNTGATYVAVASASDVDTKQQLLLTGHDDGTFTAGTRFAVTVPATLVAANIDRVTGFGFSVSIDGATYVDVEVAQANVVLNEGAASYAVVIDNIPEAYYATDIKAKAYVSIGTTKVYFNEVGYSVADMVAAYAAAPEGLTAEQVQLLADFAAAYSA